MGNYNGPTYDGMDTNNSANSEYSYSVENDLEKKSNKGLIIGVVIGIIVVVIVLLIVIVSLFTVSDTEKESATINNETEVDEPDDDSEKSDREKVDEFTGMIADTWEEQGKDMSGRTLHYTYDGEEPEDSYWEFIDSKKAKLCMSDGSYYDADYLILEGELGMLYTEYKFPEYGLTYDELSRVTQANKEQDDRCKDYVVISFDNMVLCNDDGTIEDDDRSNMFYYGVTLETEKGLLYNVVGANSASYYNFIDFDEK